MGAFNSKNVHITAEKPSFIEFTPSISVTANITAAAGFGVPNYGGGGYGITAIGLKDNNFYIVGHPVLKSKNDGLYLGDETHRMWGVF